MKVLVKRPSLVFDNLFKKNYNFQIRAFQSMPSNLLGYGQYLESNGNYI